MFYYGKCWDYKIRWKILGNVLLLGSTGSGKTTLVQETASNSMFGERRGVHWISYFTPKVKFYIPQDEKDLEKTFDNLENIYGERVEKMPFDNESNDISNGMS